MKCEKESQVVHAVRSRAWSSSLLNHVGTCTACAETKLVAEALTSLAAIQLTENPAPHAILRALRRATQNRAVSLSRDYGGGCRVCDVIHDLERVQSVALVPQRGPLRLR